jgi:glycosyltransferase involved in cell wall biosynthesis
MSTLRPVRVLYVINDLARAGAETQLVELATGLDPAAYARAIVVLKDRNDFAERLAAAGVDVLPLRRSGWWDAGLPLRLRRVIHDWRPDVVHAFLFLANTITAPVARAMGVPVVVSQRCSYEATLPSPWRRVARWAHRRADRVTVNSRAALAEELAAGADATRTVYVPNGVVPDTAPPATRAALGLPEGPLVVSVGQLEEVKGHHVLLAAWPEVVRAHPEARLVLVGDGPARAGLEAQARTLGVTGNVTFLGFRPDGRRYAAAADVFVQPSLTEGMPNAVLEAMAAARPVVATRVGGAVDLIEDGVAGLLVPASAPAELSSALVELLANPARRAGLGRAAARHVADRHGFAGVTAAVEAVYASVRRPS